MDYLRGLTYLEDGIEKPYTVIEMWECQFRNECANSSEMKAFVDSLDIHEPLKPSDALYGGCTEVFCKYYKADENMGEGLRYYDVCSLYPKICKLGVFFRGHPKIRVGDDG